MIDRYLAIREDNSVDEEKFTSGLLFRSPGPYTPVFIVKLELNFGLPTIYQVLYHEVLKSYRSNYSRFWRDKLFKS